MLCRCGEHHFTYISYLCCSLETFLQSPAKRDFFFIVLQAGFAAHQLFWGVDCVGRGLHLHWGHTFGPCPFSSNPSLAIAGAGRGEVHLLESLVWNPGWEFFHCFLRKSLNQNFNLWEVGQQETDSLKAMRPMCKGWCKQQKPPNRSVGNFAHAGHPSSSNFFPLVLTCWVGLVLLGRGFCQRFLLPSQAQLCQSHCGSKGTWARVNTCPPFLLDSAFSFAFHSSFKIGSSGKLHHNSHTHPECDEHPYTNTLSTYRGELQKSLSAKILR